MAGSGVAESQMKRMESERSISDMAGSGVAESQMERMESERMSLNEAQPATPVQPVQAATPAQSVKPAMPIQPLQQVQPAMPEQARLSARKRAYEPKSRIDMLQSKGMELVALARTKATEMVDLATTKAEAVKVQAAETVCCTRSTFYSVVGQAKTRAAQVAAPVLQRASLAANTLCAAQQSAVAYAISQKEAATSSYQRLRSQGFRACFVETAKVTSGMVQDLLKQVRSSAATTYTKSLTTASDALSRGRQAAHEAAATAVKQANTTATLAREKTAKLQSTAMEVAKDSKFQATAAGAVGGAATLGATGGATGLAAGSTIGAVVGLVPAIFTFGLSIPIGAAIGGSAGLVVGTAVGSTAGLVGGGAAGYGIHAKKDDIRQGAGKTLAKVSSGADFVREGAGKTLAKVSSGADFMKSKAVQSAGYVQGRVSEVRSRLVAAAA